jgi:uncharacterized protein (TIGR03437 family)
VHSRSMKVVLVSVAALFPIGAMGQATDPVWVPGSSQKICQLVGELDHQTGQPTVSQTETNYGLIGNDLGSSFLHNGKLWFLFGDSHPAATFNGKLNLQADPPRIPADNDAVGFTSGANIDQCLKLDFVRDSIGAYQNPVVLNAQGKPAITLGIDEVPIAGIDISGRMFVVFGTDNNVANPTIGNLGFATRSVLGVSDDEGNTYHYLYDLSAPPCSGCEGAKFVNVAIANEPSDGYLYFWGSEGGAGYRHSSVFLARKPAASIAQAGGMQYLAGLDKNGTPSFTNSETGAVPLFQDYDGASNAPANCTGELGVEYNQFVQRWVMLYNCLNKTATNLNGIYMRFAQQPWGPWGAPQTIFNGQRDRGICVFIHRAVTANSPACDQAGDTGRDDVEGGSYGPYFISRFTTGAANGTSTFYYTLSTWNPYVQVIMKTTIQSAGQTAAAIGLVANAEGESGAIAPNTWVEIKGANLAPPGDTRIWKGSDFVNNQMPTQLDGVSATVNGKSAYLYYISPTQVNILTPPDATAGTAQVQLNNNGTTVTYTAQAATTSPSFFVVNGGPYVVAQHSADYSPVGPASLYPGSTTPAKPGETVVLYANGFGPISPSVVSGLSAQNGTLSPMPAVTIGGVPANVTYSGINGVPGLFQFNVVVPASAANGDQPIAATRNGLSTQPGTLITIQH